MNQPENQKKNNIQYAMNMTMASIAGQVGCLTFVVIFAALFAGLWLDHYLNTKPFFTVVILLGSVPVTLFLMFRLVKAATDRIKPIQKDSLINNTHQEEVNRD